jgi:hypothetical protein
MPQGGTQYAACCNFEALVRWFSSLVYLDGSIWCFFEAQGLEQHADQGHCQDHLGVHVQHQPGTTWDIRDSDDSNAPFCALQNRPCLFISLVQVVLVTTHMETRWSDTGSTQHMQGLMHVYMPSL